MMYRFSRGLAVLLACFFATAVPAADPAPQPDLEPGHIYSLRPDPRLCPSPICGGYWVRRVNRALTGCADGSKRAECYVASLRGVPAGGLGDGRQVLAQGRIRTRNYEGFGALGVFRMDMAWLAVTDAPATGRYVAIENNGILCISGPCFSFDEFVLSRGIVRQVSGLDFDALPKPGGGGYGLLGEGEYLIAAGGNEQRPEFSDIGLWFVASQVFLRIP